MDHPVGKGMFITCSACGKMLPMTAYYRRENGHLRQVCKVCHCAVVRDRRVIRLLEDPNFERRLRHNKIAAKPDLYRGMSARAGKKWRKNNPEKAAECSHRYRLENPEKVHAAERHWRRANPDWGRLKTARRRAQKRDCYGDVTLADWKAILERYGNRCAYCGASGKMDQDHVIPLSRGGHHVPENIVPACPHCNGSKGTKLVSEWVSI